MKIKPIYPNQKLKMKEQSKKWLISLLKTSGSKRRHIENGSFSEERNSKKYQDLENLPQHESFGSTLKTNGEKINYGLLIRFLNSQINNDWDDVYAEICDRIPSKLIEYRKIVFVYVADKTELIDNQIYNKSSHKFIWTSNEGEFDSTKFESVFFYVCPITNKLLKGSEIQTGRITTDELKIINENKKKQNLIYKKQKQEEDKIKAENAKKALLENNKKKK